MKRFFKVFSITLGSLLGLSVVVLGVVLAIAFHVVFTPEKLTPVVKQVCDSVVLKPYGLKQVNLTLYHTFPKFSLEISDFYLLNPQPGAQSDTLLAAPKVYVEMDVHRLLNNKHLAITGVEIPDVEINAYIDSVGHSNFCIDELLRLSSDTVNDDTTSIVLPFPVMLEDIMLTTRKMTFRDTRDSLDIQNLSLQLSAAAAMDSLMDEIAVEVRSCKAGWENVELSAGGYVSVTHLDTIGAVLQLETNEIGIADLRHVLPSALAKMIPSDLDVDGQMKLRATIVGQYADSTLMPEVDAALRLNDGSLSYESIPTKLKDMSVRLTAHANLSQLDQTSVTIQSLYFATGESKIETSGEISDVMGDMLLDLHCVGSLSIQDFADYIPSEYPLDGKIKQTQFDAKIRLSDLMAMRIAKGRFHGTLVADDLSLKTDSMAITLPSTQMIFDIPARDNERETTKFMSVSLSVNQLDAAMEMIGNATMEQLELRLCVNDILSNPDVICADLDIVASDINGRYELTDSLGNTTPILCQMRQPDICAYLEYDTKDTLRIPTMQAKFAFQDLKGDMDTMHVLAHQPSGEVRIRGGRRDNTQPSIAAKLSLSDMQATLGQVLDFKTEKLAVKASARHTNKKENFLLEWRPKLDFYINNASVNTSMLEDEISIPVIDFTYSNRDFVINSSRIELGRSDFSLTGDVHNIGPWLEDKGLLTGKLYFNSTQADINQLLGYVSGMGNDETELNASPENEEVAEGKVLKKEGNPFIVPKGVDIILETNIEHALAFGQNVNNLGGHVYIRDGVLILEEMGFVCNAAKLQLTAMYKTPRRNHIFAGFDYHMTDINIAELVDMIPQVDSLLPMLRSFKGAADFHLAAETYMNSHYQLKPSTLRGACSLSAKDLTLLDGETFTKIAKILTFKKSTENKIDSISVEMALYKRQLTVYPFLISCDRWMGAVGGQHYLDMTFDYHINVLKPLYIGVGVSGSFDDLKIKPEKCIYAKDFVPVRTKKLEVESADIRQVIKRSLEANVKK